jgi:hypothetical protein
MNLEIRHLRHFNDGLKRDVIADLMSSRRPTPDAALLNRVIAYGNAFLEREQMDPANDRVVIWFDVHFGNPAVVGMTWAYNPHAPYDAFYGEAFFWRMWSEIGQDSPEVASLTRCQQEFAAYTMQHVTG